MTRMITRPLGLFSILAHYLENEGGEHAAPVTRTVALETSRRKLLVRRHLSASATIDLGLPSFRFRAPHIVRRICRAVRVDVFA